MAAGPAVLTSSLRASAATRLARWLSESSGDDLSLLAHADLAAVVAQIAGAAYGAFYSAEKLGDQKGSDESKMISEKVFDHGFGFHTGFGYLIFLGAVVLLLLALAARLGKRRILWSLGVPLIVALQIVLAWISEDVHAIGILHGINALVIFGLTGAMTGTAWREARASSPVAAPAPTA